MLQIPGFHIARELGRGGMATVYVAEQLSLGREVALKVLDSRLADDPAFTERFLREGRIAASLHHSHIVAVYDVGACLGTQYIAMEYLPLGSMAAMDDPLAPRAALRCIREIAGALDYAHARGIVHRDVKSANILRHEGGAYLLSDFGIARLSNTHATLTGEGRVIGTPGYMSPEQWHDRELDGRTDLYSLGIVLYELLTGVVPYGGADRWMIGMQHMGAALPELPAEYRMLQGLLARMLAKDPDDRFATGAEVVGHIESIEREGIVPNEKAASVTRYQSSSAHTSRLMREWPHRAAGKFFGPPTEPKLWQRTRARWLAAFAATIMAIVLATIFQLRRSAESPAVVAVAHSIAVLPFADMTEARDQEYFADGMTEELLDMLAKVPGLHVAGRTSSFSFKGKNEDVASVGQKLHVATVLEGSVRKSGDHIRITTQLINVADGFHIWSETYDRRITDVFSVQDEISAAVVGALKIRLLSNQRIAAAQHRTANPQAYDQYLLGRQFFNRASADDLRLAIAAYEKAIALDPGFAAAFAGLSSAAHSMGGAYARDHDDKIRWLEKALAASRTALQLDPELAEGFAARGYLRLLDDWDVPGAQADLLRAIELNPGDSFALKWYARSLATMGKLPEAIAQIKKAADLDPLNALIWANLGVFYNATGEFAKAHDAFGRSQEILSNFGDISFSEGVTLLLERNPADALVLFQRAGAGKKPYRELCGRAMAEYDLGHAAASQQALNALIKERSLIDQYSIAAVYAWRGEKDDAFDWLERAYAERVGYMAEVSYDPLFAKLRDNPRYEALLKKMGFLSVSGPSVSR